MSVPVPATVPETAALATVCEAPQSSSVATDATESAVSAGNVAAPTPDALAGSVSFPALMPATISSSVRARFQTRTSSKDPEASLELSHDQPSRRIIDASVAGDHVTEMDFEASTAPVVALRRVIVTSKPLAVFANTSETWYSVPTVHVAVPEASTLYMAASVQAVRNEYASPEASVSHPHVADNPEARSLVQSVKRRCHESIWLRVA